MAIVTLAGASFSQVVDQDPVFILLLCLLHFAVPRSAASTHLLHIVPKESTGEPLEHPEMSCRGVRMREGSGEARGSGRRRGGVAVVLVISCGVHSRGKAP